MEDTYQTFHIGINVFVVKNNQLLLGKRKGVYGAGTWGLPGGHLETGEAMEDAAARELMEETGLQANNFEFANVVNDRSGNQHYLQIGFTAQNTDGELTLKEPDRCEEWKWFKLNELPPELFPPHIKQIENFLKKTNFIDA
ncbi:MAG: NUDIX domain-containing protein [Patescibacteria group bacterium]|nr:NUDIX domain-containing protein [Patescibacteria group bacterium]